jgi:hypothetical protein
LRPSHPRNYYFNPGNFSYDRLIALDDIASQDATQLPYFTYRTFPRNAVRGPGAITDATFGQIFNTADPRNLQLALHLRF